MADFREMARKFLNQFVTDAAEFVDVQRADLASWLNEQDISELTATFLEQRDQDQLAVVGFRLRTWARRSNVEAVRMAADKLHDLIVFAGNIAIKLLAAV